MSSLPRRFTCIAVSENPGIFTHSGRTYTPKTIHVQYSREKKHEEDGWMTCDDCQTAARNDQKQTPKRQTLLQETRAIYDRRREDNIKTKDQL
jgi:hypothetical protein